MSFDRQNALAMRGLLFGILCFVGSGAVVLMAVAGAADDRANDSPVKSVKQEAAEATPAEPERQVQPKKALMSGKVVLLTDALKRHGIKAYDEENKGQVVLETNAGELWPIVPDWRGRALFQDERLRDRPVDLIVNRRPGIPHLQVLSIYTFDEHGARQLTDYWCDICSIPMYELKECECCQGPIRLRFQPKELPAEFGKPPTLKRQSK